MKLNLDYPTNFDLYCMLGKNGAGKTTAIDGIRYFYKMANKTFEIEDIIDKLNMYAQKMYIEITFDFSNLLTNNKNKYLETVLKSYEEYIVDSKLLVRMTQFKNSEVVWYPLNDVYFVRKILKIFPVFFVNTRFISLTDWSELWNIISEISISGIKESTEIVDEKLKDVFEATYGEKFNKSIRKIKKIFDEENIKINDKDYIVRFKNAIMTQLGGDTFLTDNNSLLYYSDGMNSLKYIKLLLKLIVDLSDTAWKNSLIILDEPEIGLHPKFIEELADLFLINRSKKVNYLLTTHSSHFISSILKNGTSVCFYRLYLINGYTNIEKIRNIIETKDTFLMNDAEAESYFSDTIVFVEGQTEIQLLKNRNLNTLFPYLKRITIYNTKSTDTVTNLILPQQANMTVPYINILDMDKILTFNTEKKKFSIAKSEINPLYNSKIKKKEKYLIYNKGGEKFYTYNLRNRIQGVLKKSTFTQNLTQFWIKNPEYIFLLKMVNLYCNKNNVFVMRTTIEGAIVNEKNYEVVLKWLETKLIESTFNKLCDLLNKYPDCIEYKTTILRLVLNGKLDSLQNMKYSKDKTGNVRANVPEDVYNGVLFIKNKIGNKTSGWVIEFIDYYLNNVLVEDDDANKEKFKMDFPELYNLLQIIDNLI